MKAVYTGIDAMEDLGLVTTEASFATGFGTTAMKANGAVYGAHGVPGWIQGLPDANGATILQASPRSVSVYASLVIQARTRVVTS
jgi:hypothetical protein